MRGNTLQFHHLIAGTLSMLAAGLATSQDEDLLFEDFESETFGEWKVEGDAFGAGPSDGPIGNQRPPGGFIGKRFINSFTNRDAGTGRLISRKFKISNKFIHFLIGGGSYAGEVCVNLVIDGKPVRTETSQSDSELLKPAFWDVGQFSGKSAHLEIVDKRQTNWGHISVDQFVFSNQPKVNFNTVAKRVPVNTGKKWEGLDIADRAALLSATHPLKEANDSLAQAKKTRSDKYITDLKALETQIASDTGNLEHVLLVRKERESWEKEKPTKPIDPKDQAMPLDLRKLRYYFDEDLKKAGQATQAARKSSKAAVIENLQALAKKFDDEKKDNAALAARSELEKLTQAAKTSSGAGATAAGQPSEFKRPDPASVKFPLSVPERPAAGTLALYSVALGLPNATVREIPKDIGKVSQVALSNKGGTYHHIVALKEDGTVVAWGNNEGSQCVVPKELKDVVEVSAFWAGSMALQSDGTPVVWGGNNKGRAVLPRGVEGETVSIALGSDYSMYLLRSGHVKVASTVPRRQPPREVREIVKISGGNIHCLALASDGEVFGWGSGGHKQWQVPDDLPPIVDIAASGDGSAALDVNGKLHTWGMYHFKDDNGIVKYAALLERSAAVKNAVAIQGFNIDWYPGFAVRDAGGGWRFLDSEKMASEDVRDQTLRWKRFTRRGKTIAVILP